MLATLIPLFDHDMNVCAYSIFAQKENFLLNPRMLGVGRFDGASNIEGMEIVESMGLDTVSGDKAVFIEMNSISLFSDIASQCDVPHDKQVLLIDKDVPAEERYIERIRSLRKEHYRLAIRKLPVSMFESYKEILKLVDYVFLNHKKIDITKAKVYFSRMYPNVKLVAVNVNTKEEFEVLKEGGGYDLYEGEFFRTPVKHGEEEIAPIKTNYLELLNIVNDIDFDLTDAAEVIGRDPALVISLLEMVNRMTVNSGINSVRHAAAMLGQRELKKWINTAVTKELCADKPSEILRTSLIRARFAENLAPVFQMGGLSSELFLMGLFSVLDVILEKPMSEALDRVKISKDIRQALIDRDGQFAPIYDFVLQYEGASWQEVSRQMVIAGIEEDTIYKAYIDALRWYKELFNLGKK
ncbi:MAG: HDOD domain-containing protein [Lachnospiraceae bacterium]|nr:HDOD domain-containing protein [Lachnospiraceae bacterium]